MSKKLIRRSSNHANNLIHLIFSMLHARVKTCPYKEGLTISAPAYSYYTFLWQFLITISDTENGFSKQCLKLVSDGSSHARSIDLPTDAIFPVYHRAADRRPNFTEHVEPTAHFPGCSFSSFSE